MDNLCSICFFKRMYALVEEMFHFWVLKFDIEVPKIDETYDDHVVKYSDGSSSKFSFWGVLIEDVIQIVHARFSRIVKAGDYWSIIGLIREIGIIRYCNQIHRFI